MVMKIKGDLQVCRTVDAARRVNQGLQSITASGAVTLVAHSAYWQRIDVSSSQDVNLPDATTLSNAWKIVVESNGSADLVVKDNGGNIIQNVGSGTAYEFTLLNNVPTNGEWHINFLEDAGNVPATRYTETFDATSDWGTASGGYYTITVDESSHNRGSTPIAQVFELSGSDYSEVLLDEKKISSNGDLSMIVIDDPDCRFEGMVVLI